MFCPSLHTLEGLRPEQAVEAVLAGYRGQTQVRGGVLLVALRSSSREHGVQMARLAARYLQHRAEDPVGVVGLDVAGDEGSFPLASDQAPMAGGVREAALLSVPLTLHAGEWPERFGSVENLAWAVSNENTRRLGHAVTVRSRPDLADLMVARNITVEVCLTSNIGHSIRVRIMSIRVLSVRKWFQGGQLFSSSREDPPRAGSQIQPEQRQPPAVRRPGPGSLTHWGAPPPRPPCWSRLGGGQAVRPVRSEGGLQSWGGREVHTDCGGRAHLEIVRRNKNGNILINHRISSLPKMISEILSTNWNK